MLDILNSILTGQNEFASGGFVLMIVGVVSVWLRAVPERLWDWLVCQTTMTVTVSDDDAAFQWVKEWFLEQKFVSRVRRVDLDTTVRNERIALIPAPGRHWFWYCGRPFQVWFSRTEDSSDRISRRLESLTFRTVGRNRAVLRRFVDDVVQCHLRRQGVQSYLYLYNDGWDSVEGYSPRLLESVILPAGEKEDLLADMTQFRRSKGRYETLGVPYHRGYLFYGPPGTGKTSLVSALAAHFGVSIYVLNLAEFNDRSLAAAVSQVPAHSILLFEDIDCMSGSPSRAPKHPEGVQDAGHGKENASPPNSVTLSGLLNVLDGFLAPAGVIFVMTTNRLELLDPALLRPGRIDYRLYMGKACDQQKLQLYRRFFPGAPEWEGRQFVESAPAAETMAEFQGALLALARSEARWSMVTADGDIAQTTLPATYTRVPIEGGPRSNGGRSPPYGQYSVHVWRTRQTSACSMPCSIPGTATTPSW
jgi:chaperone BCS1